MNEAETRMNYITPDLRSSSWGVNTQTRIRPEFTITLGRIEGHGRRGHPQSADYVLEYNNRKLAVVEAKRWDLGLTDGVQQAKRLRHARCSFHLFQQRPRLLRN